MKKSMLMKHFSYKNFAIAALAIFGLNQGMAADKTADKAPEKAALPDGHGYKDKRPARR